MKIKYIFILLVFAFLACYNEESPKNNFNSNEELLREIMSLSVRTPSNELSSVVYYTGDGESLYSTREIYYPIIGDVNYHVNRNFSQDTISIGLNFFNKDGSVKSSYNYSFVNQKPIWQSTKDYLYIDENKLDKVLITTDNKINHISEKHYYNTENQLIQIEYPFSGGSELELFSYDIEGRILNHWRSVKGEENSKKDYFVYRYNGDQLVAKETGTMGSKSNERQDATQFFYDDKGRLKYRKDFDPYFGFQQKSKMEYFYHEEG